MPLAGVAPATTSIVRCQLEVVTPGKFTLQLGDAQGITLWQNGARIPAAPTITMDLTRGVHTFVFRRDLSARKEPALSWELLNAPGSTGQALHRW